MWVKLNIPPIFGLFLFLGELFFEERLMYVGLVLLAGWTISRFFSRMVLSTINKLTNQERIKNNAQAAFDAMTPPQKKDPNNEKKLKDEYDRIKAKEWRIRSWKMGQLFVRLLFSWFILFAITTAGTGEGIIFSKLKGLWSELSQSPIIGESIKIAKKEGGWLENRKILIRNKLQERYVSPDDCKEIYRRINSEEQADLVISALDETPSNGGALKEFIVTKLTSPPSPSITPTNLEPENQRGIRAKLIWLLDLLVLPILAVLLLVLIVLGAIVLIVNVGMELGSEGADRLFLYMETRKAKQAGLPQPSTAPTGTPPGTTQPGATAPPAASGVGATAAIHHWAKPSALRGQSILNALLVAGVIYDYVRDYMVLGGRGK